MGEYLIVVAVNPNPEANIKKVKAILWVENLTVLSYSFLDEAGNLRIYVLGENGYVPALLGSCVDCHKPKRLVER